MSHGSINTEEGERKGGLGGSPELNHLTEKIIGAAMRVHSALGPGLLESAYEACLAHELEISGHAAIRQKRLPIVYRDLKLDEGYRIDLFVDDRVIVELKAIERILPVHEAQLLSYLRLASCEVGLLINFHVRHLREGIRRVINTRSTLDPPAPPNTP